MAEDQNKKLLQESSALEKEIRDLKKRSKSILARLHKELDRREAEKIRKKISKH